MNEDRKTTLGILAGKRKVLLAGAVSLGLVGLIGVEAFVGPTGSAQAQSVPAPAIQAPQPGPNGNGVVTTFSFADVVDRVAPAVVSIRVKGERQQRTGLMEGMPDIPEGHPLERFFREFGERGGPNNPSRGRPENRPNNPVTSQGSGFIISTDGKVVTNFHVVKGASEVSVLTSDGTELKAHVVGSDEKTDVALIQIDEKGKTFPTVSFASRDIRVGDWVLAVGNPFGLGGSVTAGIVSARGREIGAGPYDDFLQIDAPINRGNSGGPTFNLAGEVVGVNTAIFSPSGGSVGIGFAIPTATVQRVIQQLETNGEVVRGWLGVQIQPINRDIADGLGLKDARGALVSEPQPDSPAAKAGIKSGDAILAVEGKTVRNPRDLARTIADYDPGATVKVKILRGGREQEVSVVLGKLPTDTTRLSDNRRRGNSDETDGQQTSLADLGLAVAPAGDVGEGDRGVAVVRVDPDGTAARRGLQVGDVILEVQGQAVSTPRDMTRAIRDARSDGRRTVLARIKRGDQTRFVPLPLAAS